MENIILNSNEIETFRSQGYLGPYSLCSADEMMQTAKQIESVLNTDPPDHKNRVHNRHLDNQLIHQVSTDPQIVKRMACLYGDDLLLWRTNFFVKESGAKEIPWHQDFNYWPLEPPIIVSAWIAIDQSTVENGCLKIIPGSHRRVIPHLESKPNVQFTRMGDPDYIDLNNIVTLEMEPGEFILFNERTLHQSDPNHSSMRRIGLAVRVVIPIVKVLDWDSPEHSLVPISGKDRMRINDRSQNRSTSHC